MVILVNGSPAVLKAGSSFEYIAENRLFSGADDYTLAITLPLKDCPQNIEIFGQISRMDVRAKKIRYDCELRCDGFSKAGVITITEISDSDLKAQFLAGRSAQNFDDTFDSVYINELNLGTPPYTDPSKITPANAWNNDALKYTAVALPWVNEESGNIQNLAEYEQSKGYYWSEKTKSLSWQPYLLYITKQICSAVGYSYDFSAWENSGNLRGILICNCLPSAWNVPDYARALPHWTVDEYFEKLGLFLKGDFSIDHKLKKISFAFVDSQVSSKSVVHIENVVDEYSTKITDKKKSSEYLYNKNIAFKDSDHIRWPYMSCKWIVDNPPVEVKSYDTLSALLAAHKGLNTSSGGNHRGSDWGKMFYAKDVDTYFIPYAVESKKEDVGNGQTNTHVRYELIPLNSYGPKIVDESEEAESAEIEFVPAHIDFTETKYGNVLFLNPSSFSEDTTASSSGETTDIEESIKTGLMNMIEAGNESETAEYYDSIYVGWFTSLDSTGGHLPHPFVENISVRSDWEEYKKLDFNFRVNDGRYSSLLDIDPTEMATFKFIADSIPDPLAVFNIHGRRYVCEKITATFTEDGMSRLMKGNFYPIKDS